MNPVLVEVLRGGRLESAHRGAVTVVDARGSTLLAIGDVAAPVYPRSTVKPLQAMPLVASGAADRLGINEAELAIACGSHGGEPLHVATALSMLRKAGRDPGCLECGAHWPLDEPAARGLAARGEEPSALHNNCSGKHAGFICLACFRRIDPRGYVRPEHPVMREVTAALEAVTQVRLTALTPGIDGCSIPTFPLPLLSLAAAFARFGTGEGLPGDLASAAARLLQAVAAHPTMVAGPGRFDTRIIETTKAGLFIKSGAEGTACATIPAAGLGIAIKIDDGAGRAAQAAMAATLTRFAARYIDAEAQAALAEATAPILKNWNGFTVGCLKPTEEFMRAIM